jgi:hypothetical protein
MGQGGRSAEECPFPRIGDLEIDQDPAFERRDWVMQRLGWVVIALLILAGLTGLVGSSGPFATTIATPPDGQLRLSSTRFARHSAPTDVRVQVAAGAVAGDRLELWLNRSLFDRIEVEQIVPEPEAVAVGPDRVQYVLPLLTPGTPVTVTIMYQPHHYGRESIQVGLVTGAVVQARQFVYP